MREAVARGKGVVYVRAIRPNCPEDQGFPPSIGVPCDDVFAYNEALFERLRKLWKAGIEIKADEWGELCLVQEPARSDI